MSKRTTKRKPGRGKDAIPSPTPRPAAAPEARPEPSLPAALLDPTRLTVGVIALFLVSGATSLVYEIVWARHLQLVFGTSQLAISTVLAAFMAGLALGGLAAARWAQRVTRPLLAYGILEAFIGLYALVLPSMLTATAPFYLRFFRNFDPGPVTLGALQAGVVSALLLLPTFCMGATLPLLVRFSTRGNLRLGATVGRLYGANTLGAVLGTAAAGFVLLPRFGTAATTGATVAANGLIAVAAIAISVALREGGESKYSAPNAPASTPPNNEAQQQDLGLTPLLALAALTGASSLLYEVSWFRLMTLLLGGSAYAFSIMLLAFLLGIGLGGWAAGPMADRSLLRGGQAGLLRGLGKIQVMIAVLAWAAMFGYAQLPFMWVWLYDRLEGSSYHLLGGQLLLALLVMTPPALFMGASFPYLVRVAGGRYHEAGTPVGLIYGFNTLGAIVGALGGTLLLLPALHVRGSVLLAAAVNLLVAAIAAVAATLAAERRARARAYGLALAAVGVLLFLFKPPWDPLLMTTGLYTKAFDLRDRSRQGVLDYTVGSYDLVFYEEGLSSVVTVSRSKRDPSHLWLSNNGKNDASTGDDMKVQTLLAHLPFAFRPSAERVAVIGLASGITAGGVTLHDSPRRIDLIEIEPEVVAASHEFDAFNHQPLADPRVQLVVNDARNHLLLVPDGAYDLVTSEPSNPWLTGVANLFTREFFALGERKLDAEGVWAQWLHAYEMAPEDLRSLLATFADVFEHVRVFRVDIFDLVLVGSRSPLPLSVESLRQALFQDLDVRANLARVDMPLPETLLAHYLFARPAIQKLADGVALNTDDNMRIEYSAPLHLFDNTLWDNAEMLLRAAEPPFDALGPSSEIVRLAEAYAQEERWQHALATVEHALREDPESQELLEMRERYGRQAERPTTPREGRR